MKDLALLYRSVRRFQERNQFVANATGSTLSLAESHLLVELDAQPSIRAVEISNLLGMSKTAVSRIVRDLVEKKMIKTLKRAEDQRSAKIEMLQAGRKALRIFDHNSNTNLEKFLIPMSDSEQVRLLEYFRIFADGLDAPHSNPRPEEHAFRPTIRRLTRAFGQIGSGLFKIKTLTSLQWHSLLAVQELRQGAPMSNLVKRFGVPANTLSQTISTLEKQQLVRKLSVAHDKRNIVVQLSKKGEKFLQSVEAQAISLIGAALQGLGASQIHEFSSLAQRFVEDSSSFTVESVVIDALVVSLSCEDAVRKSARTFVINQLVQQNRSGDAPESLFAADSFAAIAKRGEVLQCVFEFKRIEGNYRLILAERVAEFSKEEFLACARQAILVMKQKYPGEAITVAPYLNADLRRITFVE